MSTFIAQGRLISLSIGPVLNNCCRKGKDYTYLYGKHVGGGSLTPYIDKAFDPRVDEYVHCIHSRTLILMCSFRIILDGEMLVWDPISERNLPFGTLKTAALGETAHHRFIG